MEGGRFDGRANGYLYQKKEGLFSSMCPDLFSFGLGSTNARSRRPLE